MTSEEEPAVTADGGEGQTSKKRGQSRRGHPWWVLALILFWVACIVMVIFLAPVTLTSTASYCGSCKSMKAAQETWSHSVHSDVECVKCHVEPGFDNGIAWRLGEAKNIWASYLGADQAMVGKARAVPSDAACEQCHPVDEIPDVVDGIKMPHEMHVTMRGLKCADCHNKVSHAPAGISTKASMSVCSMCHKQDGAPAACTTCHTEKMSVTVHAPDYLKTHGANALGREDDCLRCHHDKAAFCDDCHSRPPANHFAGDWRYSHGPEAKADELSCTGCHNYATFCDQCHRVSHPDDWRTSHGEVAAKSSASCLVCHPQSMCERCHSAKGIAP